MDGWLWALYADSCSGIAIELELPDSLEGLSDVKYNHKLAIHRETSGEPDLKDILRHKTDIWSYECEYRYIGTKEFLDVTGMISRVIVGPRCSLDDELLLKSLAPVNAEFVRSEISSSFKGVISKLHPDYRKYHGTEHLQQ